MDPQKTTQINFHSPRWTSRGATDSSLASQKRDIKSQDLRSCCGPCHLLLDLPDRDHDGWSCISIVDTNMSEKGSHSSMHSRVAQNLQLIVVVQSDSVVPSSSRSSRYFGVPIYRPMDSRRAVYLSVPLYGGNEMGEPRDEATASDNCDADIR